jgi:hypothetical protein
MGVRLMSSPRLLKLSLAAAFAFFVAGPVLGETWGQATVNPLSLAEEELAAETRGDVATAIALYSDAAIVQYGGLCSTPCVGKASIQKELERRAEAKNEWKVIGKYRSGNVAVIQTELKIGFIGYTGVDRVVVWCIYEVVGDKIAVVTLVGQRTDPETKRFIDYATGQAK